VIFRRLALIAAVLLVPTMAWGYLTDTASHPPPTTGAYAYYNTFGSFGPDRPGFLGVGQTFVDPVFGSTIRRLTNDIQAVQSESDIYGKNGYWNADGTRMYHNTTAAGRTIVDTTTGAVVRSNIPGNYDGSFAPDDADTWYYLSGASLRKYSVATGANSLVKTFPATLGSLGGSLDWIDRTGRYMVLSIGGQARVWDKQDDVLYAGAVPGTAGDGWIAISPDAKYVVTALGDDRQKRSYAINHATRTLSTAGVMFWSLCGGHGDLLSATDGKTYFVTFECHEEAAVYAVDVSLQQTTTPEGLIQQRATNRRLLDTEWADDGHVAAAARGMFQDWAFVSIESNDDPFAGGVSDWRPYKQEIVMANVLTGELRRLAHHRSRGLSGGSYYYQPRVSVSWDGTRVGWASNFGYAGADYGDIYMVHLDSAGPPPPPPVSPTVSFTNPAAGATVSGTVTVTMAASGGSGAGYTYRLAVDGITIYSGTNPTTSWNTTAVSNATHTLRATVTDSAGGTGTVSRSVSVSNAAAATLKVKFKKPELGATVSGTKTVVLNGVGGSGTGYTYTLAVDGVRVYSGTSRNVSWNTTTVSNGLRKLTATVRDSLGATDATSLTVTVANGTGSAGLVATLTSPTGATTLTGVVPVRMTVTGSTASTRTFTLYQDGFTMWTATITGTSATWNWDTGWWAADGSHTLKLKVTDSAGKSDTAERVVQVFN
jgi:Bacterial Ig domain